MVYVYIGTKGHGVAAERLVISCRRANRLLFVPGVGEMKEQPELELNCFIHLCRYIFQHGSAHKEASRTLVIEFLFSSGQCVSETRDRCQVPRFYKLCILSFLHLL